MLEDAFQTTVMSPTPQNFNLSRDKKERHGGPLLPFTGFISFCFAAMGTSPIVTCFPTLPSIAVFSHSSARNDAADVCSRQLQLRRRDFLGGLVVAGGSILGGPAVAAEDMGAPEIGLREGRIRGCDCRPPCVSTSAFQSPSRFMPPWTYLGTQEDAYIALKRALQRIGTQVVNEDGRRYVHAVLSSTNLKEEVDDLEFLFKGEVVCYRSVSRVFIPDPPFCWWSGCIKGPRNRGRLEKLRDDLGWVPSETDEDKQWVPLLLH